MRPISRFPAFGIWWICIGGILVFLVKIALFLPIVPDLLMKSDNDDLMRLVEVRDWLAGQSWFDTTQYRVLPPEGISMHWSRYVDAGIAAFYLPLSWLFGPERAELMTVTLWPFFLAALLILVIGHGSYRLFGPAGAIGGLIILLSWGKLGGEFIPTRIDHHNVQILCATAVFFLSVVPGRARILGGLAGLASAMALAVGLEMLPALATIWGIMALRHAYASPTAGDWLLGFCLTLGLAAPLLMIGQTPIDAWTTPYCDVLAPPVLALALVGIAASLVPVLAARFLRGPLVRVAVMLLIGALGLWLAAPLLLPCSAGPYSEVPPEVRRVILERINEARSAAILLNEDVALLLRVLLPPVVISLLSLVGLWRLWPRLSPVQRAALLQTLGVVLVGIAFAGLQIRAANLIAPALPLLAGFLLYGFTLIPRGHRLRAPAALLLLLALPATVQTASVRVTAWLGLPSGPQLAGDAPVAEGAPKPYGACRTHEAMAEIASLPEALIFTSMVLGPAILAYTPHSVTSAPYHRSPAAYWNGSVAYDSPENLRKAIAQSGAGLLVVCTGELFEMSSAFLRPGNLPDWLVEVTGDRQLVRVFKIDRGALARAEGSP